MQHLEALFALLDPIKLADLTLDFPKYKLVYYAEDPIAKEYTFLDEKGEFEQLTRFKP